MLIHRLLYAMHAFIRVHFIYSRLYLCDPHVSIFHCYQPEVKLSLCNLSYLISSFPSLYPVDVTLSITDSINKNANKQGMGFIGSLDQKYTRQFAEEQKDLQELPGWVLPSQTVLSTAHRSPLEGNMVLPAPTETFWQKENLLASIPRKSSEW